MLRLGKITDARTHALTQIVDAGEVLFRNLEVLRMGSDAPLEPRELAIDLASAVASVYQLTAHVFRWNSHPRIRH